MQIQREVPEKHSIQAYTDHSITLQDQEYCASVIISREEIIQDITIRTLADIDQPFMDKLLSFDTKIILLGHTETGRLPPPFLLKALGNKQVALECMSIGSACRTWNILLSEGRSVVAGFIFNDYP